MRCAATWEDVPDCVPDRQDVVFILGNAKKIPQFEALLRQLKGRMVPGGSVYYGDEARVYCQTQG